MKKVTLALIAAITLSSVSVNPAVPTAHIYAAQTSTNCVLFSKIIDNNNIKYEYNNHILTLSGTGVADKSYLNLCKADDIHEIIIKPGITAIGDEAFAKLKNLNKLTIPDTVKSLGTACLSGISLDSLVIPSSVKNIGFRCMSDSSVTSLTMPGTFDFSIDPLANSGALMGYDDESILDSPIYTILPRAKTVYLNTDFNTDYIQFFHTAQKVITSPNDNTYKTYGNNIYTKDGKTLIFVPAFTKKLKIRKGCETISLKSFTYTSSSRRYYCDDLVSISVPSSVRTIDEDSWVYDKSLKKYSNIKWNFKSKKKVSGDIIAVLANTTDKKTQKKYLSSKYGITKKNNMYISYDKKLVKYTGKQKELTISKKIKGISPYAFQNTKVKKVTLPSKMKTIGAKAFAESNVSKVKLPSKLTSIGNRAFYSSNVKEIKIPKTVKSIGKGAFGYTKITKIKLPSKLKEISDSCFKSTNLKSIVIPKNVTKIGNNAFDYCDELNKIKWNNKVSNIGSEAFCLTNITSITLPDSVKSCGNYCFSSCYKLSSITLSKNMSEIPDHFLYDSGLVNINIPNGITKIGAYAFAETKLLDITLPDSVVECGESCFESCRLLQNITFSKNMKSIPKKMLYNTSIYNITIPGSIKNIGPGAVRSYYLQNVVLENGVETIALSSFALSCEDEYEYNDKKNSVNIYIPKSVKTINFDPIDYFSERVLVASSTPPLSATVKYTYTDNNRNIDINKLRELKTVYGYIDSASNDDYISYDYSFIFKFQ
ncbi:MAG: hypothetical protein E7254_00895 [Lachnospiraceae bacterium]|nr:hypothetical protein [Lachnospiraceae bacterium]